VGENGLRIAFDYLRNYIERHVALATETAVERLAKTLLKLGHQTGKIHPDGVEIRATNDELSALADISRFTASRALSDWVRAGTISKGRGRILLHAPEALIID
jgi:CRP/FNR family transcriptional regulator, cyclic AMP receptor protein